VTAALASYEGGQVVGFDGVHPIVEELAPPSSRIMAANGATCRRTARSSGRRARMLVSAASRAGRRGRNRARPYVDGLPPSLTLSTRTAARQGNATLASIVSSTRRSWTNVAASHDSTKSEPDFFETAGDHDSRTVARVCNSGPMPSPSFQPSADGAPLGHEPLDPVRATRIAPMFKALGDPVRLRLLSMIASAGSGEVCVCDLSGAFHLTGPTISHHLKVLREAGLVDSDRRGTWVYYRLIPATLSVLTALLDAGGTIIT
jgi:ArsR family transcriptional regulator